MRSAWQVAFALTGAGSLCVGCGVADRCAPGEGARTSRTTQTTLHWPGESDEPLPIPGGTFFVDGLPAFHVFPPGPADNPFYAGPNIDPLTITNFRGLVMIAEDYSLAATAQGSDGSTYQVGTDMRVFKGTYRTATGDHDGTFCFI
jgi:hypothetical protein